MAKNKYFTFGKVIRDKDDKGKARDYIALGQKNPEKPQYDFDVEITITDKSGNVIAKQKNGFVNIQNPRTLADDLLARGVNLSEEQLTKMRERAAKVPEKISRELVLTIK